MLTTYRVVTHVHSAGSNRLANRSYPLISSFLAREVGQAAQGLPWFECETTLADLEEVLAGRRTSRPVDLLFLTDHVSARRHVVDEEALALARRCHRFGVGAEIQTVLSDRCGGWIDAPEVLVYGPAGPHDGPLGRHYGITQALLDDLYDCCTPLGAPAPDTVAVHGFCEARRLACALAHPLDGHDLRLEQLLALIGLFDVVEVVNGGFSQRSARLLERLLAARRRENERRRSPAHEAGAGLPAALALGGSDAHVDDFDRVVTLFAATHRPTAGDFIAAMLAARRDPSVRERFAIEGRGIATLTLYREVMTLVVRNIRRLSPCLPGLGLQARVLIRGVLAASSELRRLDRSAARLQAELCDWLDREEGGLDPAPWHLAADLLR
ncbi:MAG TPA: hypothetical protein PKK95_09300 [Vicinamibacterales bacterium]|nr:hypothetical protein [Vicinamibacterales bacterium]